MINLPFPEILAYLTTFNPILLIGTTKRTPKEKGNLEYTKIIT
jgi:hypothetical protein